MQNTNWFKKSKSSRETSCKMTSLFDITVKIFDAEKHDFLIDKKSSLIVVENEL